MENKHVIDIQTSIVAGIVQKGSRGNDLDFSYDKRKNPDILDELGLSLLNMCNHIPNGILVVFSSYGLMNSCRF